MISSDQIAKNYDIAGVRKANLPGLHMLLLGFFAGMFAAQIVGFMLDYSADGRAYTWADFRFAWWAVTITWGIGMIGLFASRIAVTRRRAARAEAGENAVKIVEESEG